jgi:hypothetical protein
MRACRRADGTDVTGLQLSAVSGAHARSSRYAEHLSMRNIGNDWKKATWTGTINGALVTLSGPAGTGPRTTRTGVDGTFSFNLVPTTSLSLQVEAPGFERWSQTVAVTATSPPLSVVMQIAGVVESIGVVAPKLEEELPQIIECSGVRAKTITATEIHNDGYYDVAQALQALVPGLFLTPKAGPFVRRSVECIQRT